MIIPRTLLKTSSGSYYYNINKNTEDYRKVVLPLIEKAFSNDRYSYVSRYYQQKVANVICNLYNWNCYSMEEQYTIFFSRMPSKELSFELVTEPILAYNLLKGSEPPCQNAAEQ